MQCNAAQHDGAQRTQCSVMGARHNCNARSGDRNSKSSNQMAELVMDLKANDQAMQGVMATALQGGQ